MTTRLSVNINDETAGALRALAAEHGTSVTEQVRRAVSVLEFFEKACERGDDIVLVDRNGGAETIVRFLG